MATHTEIPIAIFEETILTSEGSKFVEIEQLKIDGEECFRCVVTPVMPINASVNNQGILSGEQPSTSYLIKQIVPGVWIDAETKEATAFSEKISKVIEAKLAKVKKFASEKEEMEEYNKIIPFEKPYTFGCIVGNKHLTAKIIGKHNNPIHYMFVIEFSDGTKIKTYSQEAPQGFYLDSDDKHYESQKKYFYAALPDIKLFFKNGGSNL